MDATWSSCLNAPTDVKELIPEFYACAAELSGGPGVTTTSAAASVGEFLTNTMELDLGQRQNGSTTTRRQAHMLLLLAQQLM